MPPAEEEDAPDTEDSSSATIDALEDACPAADAMLDICGPADRRTEDLLDTAGMDDAAGCVVSDTREDDALLPRCPPPPVPPPVVAASEEVVATDDDVCATGSGTILKFVLPKGAVCLHVTPPRRL